MTSQGSLFGSAPGNPPCCTHALSWHDEKGRCTYLDCTGSCQPALPSPSEPGVKVSRNARATSRAAAALVLPRSGGQRYRVLMAIAAAPATDEELQRNLGLSPDSERPRRGELVDQGWVEDSGQLGKTSMGNDSIIWTLSARGRQALQQSEAS